jgi:membrane protease YdiL (CAAX protease family)
MCAPSLAALAALLPSAPHEAGTPSASLWSGLLLAAAGLCLWPLWRRALLWAAPGRNVFFVSWGFSQVVIAVLGAALANFAVGALVSGPAAGPSAFLAALAAVAAVAVWTSRKTQREPLRSLGLAIEQPGRALAAAGVALAVALPLLVGLSWAWPELQRLLAERLGSGTASATSAAPDGGLASLGPVWLWGAALLLSPALQELCLRGYLQPLLIQNFSERGGLLLSALIFAAMHGAAGFPVLFALGLVLAEVKLRTHSTWAAWMTHVLYMALCIAQDLGGAAGAHLPPTF